MRPVFDLQESVVCGGPLALQDVTKCYEMLRPEQNVSGLRPAAASSRNLCAQRGRRKCACPLPLCAGEHRVLRRWGRFKSEMFGDFGPRGCQLSPTAAPGPAISPPPLALQRYFGVCRKEIKQIGHEKTQKTQRKAPGRRRPIAITLFVQLSSQIFSRRQDFWRLMQRWQAW